MRLLFASFNVKDGWLVHRPVHPYVDRIGISFACLTLFFSFLFFCSVMPRRATPDINYGWEHYQLCKLMLRDALAVNLSLFFYHHVPSIICFHSWALSEDERMQKLRAIVLRVPGFGPQRGHPPWVCYDLRQTKTHPKACPRWQMPTWRYVGRKSGI